MAVPWLIFLYVALLGGLLVTLLLGEHPSFEGTVVQKAHYFITVGLWEAAEWGIGRVFGSRGTGAYRVVVDMCCNRPNPLTQLFYLAIIGGSYYLFGTHCFDSIPGRFVSSIHSYTAPLAVLGGLLTFALTCFSDPGVITQENVHRYLSAYACDGVIYQETMCSTCQLPKPARSKHCSVCNRCVARFDHHCGWMNNCVGEKNVRYFLLFLLVHSLICIYGGYLLIAILAGEVHDRHLAAALLGKTPFRKAKLKDWLPHTLQWLLVFFSVPMMLLLLALVLGLLLLAFFSYHVYLVYINTTTNETFKWMDYQVWKAHQVMEAEEAIAKEKERVALLASDGVGETSQAGELRGADLQNGGWDLHSGSGASSNSREGSGRKKNVQSYNVCCWPFRRQRSVYWVDPSSIKLNNIYNRGFLENLSEVIWPLSSRRFDEKAERKRGKRKIG